MAVLFESSVGDELLNALLVILVVTLLVISWVSTDVREYNFPANLLVIERRSRRLYTTTNLNGNLNSNYRTRLFLFVKALDSISLFLSGNLQKS